MQGLFYREIREMRRRALDEQMQHSQQCLRVETEEAGPNPVVTDAETQERCVLYLETPMKEYAALGRDEVVIAYTDVPDIQQRLQSTQRLLHFREGDKKQMIEAVRCAFIKKHGAEFLFNALYMGNSFRIRWQ
jgi:hypothetical protein